MTAGRTSPAEIPNALSVAADSLKSLGAKTYVIPIGKEPDEQKLLSIVQSKRDIFKTESFSLLPIEMPYAARRIGEQTGMSVYFQTIVLRLSCSDIEI